MRIANFAKNPGIRGSVSAALVMGCVFILASPGQAAIEGPTTRPGPNGHGLDRAASMQLNK